MRYLLQLEDGLQQEAGKTDSGEEEVNRQPLAWLLDRVGQEGRE